MTYGGFAYGASAIGGAPLLLTCSAPSANLVVMELLEKPPGYLNIGDISRFIDDIICKNVNR